MEIGLGLAKVDGEVTTPHSAALGETPSVVLCLSGKEIVNHRQLLALLIWIKKNRHRDMYGSVPGEHREASSRSKAKIRTPSPQLSSAGERSAVTSTAISSRGEGRPDDCPRRLVESSSRNKAIRRTISLQLGSAGERGVAPSVAVVEIGSEFAKVDGETTTPHSTALGKTPTVVLCSSGKEIMNRRAAAGALDSIQKN
uniref:Uncharacterized protein n=1 Tax=Oryza punctata TaxID=4537 RepID=A0A0E0LIT1_ORYPU